MAHGHSLTTAYSITLQLRTRTVLRRPSGCTHTRGCAQLPIQENAGKTGSSLASLCAMFVTHICWRVYSRSARAHVSKKSSLQMCLPNQYQLRPLRFDGVPPKCKGASCTRMTQILSFHLILNVPYHILLRNRLTYGDCATT